MQPLKFRNGYIIPSQLNCGNLSMLGLKLNHLTNSGPRYQGFSIFQNLLIPSITSFCKLNDSIMFVKPHCIITPYFEYYVSLMKFTNVVSLLLLTFHRHFNWLHQICWHITQIPHLCRKNPMCIMYEPNCSLKRHEWTCAYGWNFILVLHCLIAMWLMPNIWLICVKINSCG